MFLCVYLWLQLISVNLLIFSVPSVSPVTVHWAARGRSRFSEKYLLLRRILSPKTSSVPLCFRPVNAYVSPWQALLVASQREDAYCGTPPSTPHCLFGSGPIVKTSDPPSLISL